MPAIFDAAGGSITEARPVDREHLGELRARIIIAADAMAVAMAAFTNALVAAERITQPQQPAIPGEPDQMLESTPELEICMQECMLGDLECVSACIEQAKVTAA